MLSTENPEMLVWVNAGTDEVQHCQQIVVTNTVILKENQNTKELRETCCKRCHIESKERP